jgi:hypothetical protein
MIKGPLTIEDTEKITVSSVVIFLFYRWFHDPDPFRNFLPVFSIFLFYEISTIIRLNDHFIVLSGSAQYYSFFQYP